VQWLFAKRTKTRPYSRRPEIDRSLRHSVKDGVAYSVMSGAGEAYLSAFALLLKASPGQIGLLAALPPLTASIAQMVSAGLGHRFGQRLRIIVFGASIQAYSWLPLILLPLAFPDYAVPLMLGCVMLYYFGANLATPQWSSLMGDLVHRRRRGRYFGYRTRLASITSFIALVSAGLILHFFDHSGLALAGFITIFVIAMFARLISVHHLKQLHDTPGNVAALEIPSWRLWRKQFVNSPFAVFSLFYALMQFSTAIASPFFTVYILRDLGLSYFQFTMNSAMVVLAQFLTLNWWGRIADTLGNRLILVTTGALIPFIPALWTLSTEHWYMMMLQATGGLVWAGFSLSASNFIYDALPPQKRVTLMALHNTVANIGIFLGAMIGGYLATHLPKEFDIAGHHVTWISAFYGVFLISSCCRGLIALIFLPRLREVRPVKAMPVSQLIFSIARFNALWGLFFDVVGNRRSK